MVVRDQPELSQSPEHAFLPHPLGLSVRPGEQGHDFTSWQPFGTGHSQGSG